MSLPVELLQVIMYFMFILFLISTHFICHPSHGIPQAWQSVLTILISRCSRYHCYIFLLLLHYKPRLVTMATLFFFSTLCLPFLCLRVCKQDCIAVQIAINFYRLSTCFPAFLLQLTLHWNMDFMAPHNIYQWRERVTFCIKGTIPAL